MNTNIAPLSAPVLLDEVHDLESFQCGTIALDDWLKRRARANQVSGASRTYVIATERRILGYYCLFSGAIAAIDAPGAGFVATCRIPFRWLCWAAWQ